MPDDQTNEPLIPVRAVPKTQPQQPKKPQQQQRPPDDVNDFREQIRRSIANLEGSASIQDDTITQLSIAVREALDAQEARQKSVLSAIQNQQEAIVMALETTQQMHRQMIAELNRRQTLFKNPRTWPESKVAILVFAAAVVFSLALVWHG